MDSSVEQIKARLNIVDVVGSYIKLQRAGANFKACCPFHNEKTPSFHVSPARESWHCFGCNKGGDLISFVMEIEGVEFRESLELLAVRAGIELRREDPRLVSERMRLLKLMEAATAFYESKLQEEPRVGEYLAGRGLTTQTIKEFRIGYAPDEWETTVAHLRDKGFSVSEIEKSGLGILSQRDLSAGQAGDKIYDRFRGRAMFPISDASGRIVAFSGRILPFAKKTQKADAEAAKYINSPQTELYDKSRVLFCFDKAKTAIRERNVCILVEGQMDAVMSYQAGVKNVVAVSGTALTSMHLVAIKRLTDKIVTAFDMDPAGGAATKRGVDMALRDGFEVRVAVISGGKDPADIVRENPGLWKKATEETKHIIEYYLEILVLKYKNDMRELQIKISELVLPYIILLSNTEQGHWVSKIAELEGRRDLQAEKPIWEELKKIKSLRGTEVPVAARGVATILVSDNAVITRKRLLEERVLGIAAWKGGAVAETLNDFDQTLFSEELRTLFTAVTSGEHGLHRETLNTLALKAELLYDEKTHDLSSELRSLRLSLNKEHNKVLFAQIMDRIKQAELARDHTLVGELTGQAKELSKKLV